MRRGHLVYVSGPMTPNKGYPDMQANIQRLNSAGRFLFEHGYSVIVPTFMWFEEHQPYLDALNADKYGALYQNILALDFTILSRCDSIYMLSGWETSRGARAENEYARRLNITILYEGG